jgi:hypothetical protein
MTAYFLINIQWLCQHAIPLSTTHNPQQQAAQYPRPHKGSPFIRQYFGTHKNNSHGSIPRSVLGYKVLALSQQLGQLGLLDDYYSSLLSQQHPLQ